VIVVTDTSVILNLCLLGLEEVLCTIFGEVLAPPAVKEEFLRLVNADPRFTSLAFPTFIIIRPPGAIHPLLLTPRLHKGESEALSLAAEINASRVLMDERAGRAAASTRSPMHRTSWHTDRGETAESDSPSRTASRPIAK
jgi:predicted nucleic acid-binding protein